MTKEMAEIRFYSEIVDQLTKKTYLAVLKNVAISQLIIKITEISHEKLANTAKPYHVPIPKRLNMKSVRLTMLVVMINVPPTNLLKYGLFVANRSVENSLIIKR